MDRPYSPICPDAAQVDAALRRRSPALTFADELEHAFDVHERSTKSTYLVVGAAIGALIFVGFLGLDWLLMPDVFGLACLLRIGLAGPLMAFGIAVVLGKGSQRLKDGYRCGMILAGTAMVMTLFLESSSVRRGMYPYALTLMLVYVVLQRLRFRYAVATMVGTLAIVFGCVGASHAYDGRSVAAIAVYFTGVVAFLLTAAYAMERETRASFLQALRADRLHADLERSACVDPLTSLWNRRYFDAWTASTWAAVTGPGRCAFVVADVDHFKSLNDLCGHAEGDECLRRVARCLAEVASESEAEAVRLGGEEFLLAMPGRSLEEAIYVAESARQAIARCVIERPAVVGKRTVTLSFGVSAGPVREVSASDLVKSADRALYRAKADGRDCVRGERGEWRADPRERSQASLTTISDAISIHPYLSSRS